MEKADAGTVIVGLTQFRHDLFRYMEDVIMPGGTAIVMKCNQPQAAVRPISKEEGSRRFERGDARGVGLSMFQRAMNREIAELNKTGGSIVLTRRNTPCALVVPLATKSWRETRKNPSIGKVM